MVRPFCLSSSSMFSGCPYRSYSSVIIVLRVNCAWSRKKIRSETRGRDWRHLRWNKHLSKVQRLVGIVAKSTRWVTAAHHFQFGVYVTGYFLEPSFRTYLLGDDEANGIVAGDRLVCLCSRQYAVMFKFRGTRELALVRVAETWISKLKSLNARNRRHEGWYHDPVAEIVFILYTGVCIPEKAVKIRLRDLHRRWYLRIETTKCEGHSRIPRKQN